jgi:hypothetical protein
VATHSSHLHEAASACLLSNVAECVEANQPRAALLTQREQRGLSEGPALLTEGVDVDLHPDCDVNARRCENMFLQSDASVNSQPSSLKGLMSICSECCKMQHMLQT